MVGHTHRFYPINEKIKSILKTEELGELNSISIISFNPGYLKDKVNIPNWIQDKDSKSGVFMLDGIHFIDLVRWWLEKDPIKIIKISKSSLKNGVENKGMFSMIFENEIGVNVICNYSSPGVFQIMHTIIGTNAILKGNFEPNLMIGRRKWNTIPLDFPNIIKNESRSKLCC